MKKFTLLSSIFLLSACGSDSSESPRDLSDAVTIDELIEMRMSNDADLDGATVLINDNLTASFQAHTCNPLPPPTCTNDEFLSEISEPTYQGTTLACYNGFYLRSDLGREVLRIDLTEHTDFHLLNGEYIKKQANFYADIEFVERSPWCSAQVNYGLKITLKEGEEEHLLNQFIDLIENNEID